MVKDLFEEKMAENEKIKKELVDKELYKLKDTLRSEKYRVDTLIENSRLGSVYHDLIDSGDMLNSKVQRSYNRTCHSIDIETYKMNQKIDNKLRMINREYEIKKEKLELKLKENLF